MTPNRLAGCNSSKNSGACEMKRWRLKNVARKAAEFLQMEMPLPSPRQQQCRKAWAQHKQGYCEKGGGILPPLLPFYQIQTIFSQYNGFTGT